jgi:hypothetical protein
MNNKSLLMEWSKNLSTGCHQTACGKYALAPFKGKYMVFYKGQAEDLLGYTLENAMAAANLHHLERS